MKSRWFWPAWSLALVIELALLGAILAAPFPGDDLGRRSMAFESHWNLFIRRLAGCPDSGPTDATTCTRSRIVDYGEFGRARQAAKSLFDLTDDRR